jgi:hypothetical protein
LIDTPGGNGRTDLICCQVGLAIQVDDATAAIFPLSHNLLVGHESNATQDPVQRHDLVRVFQRMRKCIIGEARSLRDELLIHGLAFAQVPLCMGLSARRALTDDGRGSLHVTNERSAE